MYAQFTPLFFRGTQSPPGEWMNQDPETVKGCVLNLMGWQSHSENEKGLDPVFKNRVAIFKMFQEGGRYEEAEHRGFLGQWKYSVSYYNDG